jgi:hypothetical protein
VAQCPLIRFVGRQDKVVDICGEKLNEQFVSDVVKSVISNLNHPPIFWMVAPERSPTQIVQYVLFVQFEKGVVVTDDTLRDISREIDSAFRENFHYDYCRRLGQLEECRVFLVESSQDSFQVYLVTCVELGQRLGDIKTVALHPYQQWSTKLQGRFT